MKLLFVTLATLLNKNIVEFFNLFTTDKDISKRHYNDLHDERIRPDVKYDFKRECYEDKSRHHFVLCRVIKPCSLKTGKQPLRTNVLQIRDQSTYDKFGRCENLTSLSQFGWCKTTSESSLYVAGMKHFFPRCSQYLCVGKRNLWSIRKKSA